MMRSPLATRAPLLKKRKVSLKLHHTRKNSPAKFSRYLKWKTEIDNAANYTPNTPHYYSNKRYQKHITEGEERLLRVEKMLSDLFPDGRFEFQLKLHREVIRAVLRQILANDYDRVVYKVCEDRGWDGDKKNLFTVASRRSGKTTGMASLVATLLLCVPHIEVVVYSVALRTATEFVRLVERYICQANGGAKRIINPGGSEQLMVRGDQRGDTRRIRSFPSGGNAKNVSSLSLLPILHISFPIHQ